MQRFAARVYGRLAMADLLLYMDGYPGSTHRQQVKLAGTLRSELKRKRVQAAHPETEAPPGARGTAFEWASLAVSLAGAVPSFLQAFQGWTERHPRAAVTLEIDGDRLALDEADPEERRRLLEAFLKRHGHT